MTEKEKMLACMGYNAFDAELVSERKKCRRLTEVFNRSDADEFAERAQVMRQLLGHCPKEAYIEPPFRCDYGYNISVGKKFYANYDCVFLDVNSITIGDHVFIGPGVHIYTVSHPIDPIERRTFAEYGRPVVIRDNVWVGGRVVICPGVTIGDNTVIGAGSVVANDIPAGVVAGGNPCRVIKKV